MVKVLFYKVSRYFQFISLSTLIKLSKQNTIFPFYHLISDDEVIHIKHLYKARKIKEFERDLEFYLQEYNILDFQSLINRNAKGINMKEKCFLLSFDDGLREFYEIIAPILYKKGMQAICFLNSAFIDNKDLFYRYKTSILIERLKRKPVTLGERKSIETLGIKRNIRFDESGKFLLSMKYSERIFLDEVADILNVDFQDYLKEIKPYLTRDQVSSLLKQGFLFGAHSIDHPYYSELNIDNQLYQTTQSINEITKMFNLDYKLFSFPFTDFNISRQFFNTVFNENIMSADLTFGCAGLKKDEYNRNIQRIPIETGTFSAKDIIYGEYLYYMLKGLLMKNTLRRV